MTQADRGKNLKPVTNHAWHSACLLIIAALFPLSSVQAQNPASQIVPSVFLLLNDEQKIIPVDKPIEGVKTSVAAFVGVTETGTIYQNRPTKVTSEANFLARFGGYTTAAPYMAPAVAGFFLNGGSEAYIVKTANNSDSAIIGNSSSRTGLASLLSIDEVSIVVAPGLTSPAVTSALIAHSELAGDRIAVIDAPENGNSVAFLSDATTGYINTLANSRHAALYTPWYRASVELPNGMSQSVYIPPSGSVAGVYARVDRERGVHKSPANEPLLDAQSLKLEYSSGQRDTLTAYNVNTLLTAPDSRILIWGARTTSTEQLFKYISVSRFLMFLQESIDEGTTWVASETNDAQLWARVEGRISDFLNQQWQAGALAGATANDAYYVRCDPSTMTQAEINAGQLKCEYGVSVLRPAEFMALQLSQMTR